jgi:hypothetical protein
LTERKQNTTASDVAATEERTWTPTAESKKKATTFRWIAVVLWVVAIAAEAVAIFWLLRQREYVGEDGVLVRNADTGLLEAQGVTAQFPQWAFITLIVMLVVIAALSIAGSFLWKKANKLDPARKSDTVRFFVQNQLGAIIAVVAFLPLVLLIGAVALGIDYNPSSVEQYTADQSTVIQLLGQDEVVWVDGGAVYHVCDEVSDIQTGSEKRTGTTAEAIEAGKSRLTLKFASEMRTCGLAVPENADEIADALREIQGGAVNTALPAPVWADPADAPIEIQNAASTESE